MIVAAPEDRVLPFDPVPSRGGNLARRLLVILLYIFVVSTYTSIAVNSICLGLIAATWIVLMALERRSTVVPTPLDYFFLAYCLAELLAMAFSHNRLEALVLSKRLLLIGIVYMFGSLVTSEMLARRLVATLLGTAAVVGVLGVLKLLFGDPAETTRLGIFQFYMTTAGLMMIGTLLLVPFLVHPGTPRLVRILAGVGVIPVVVSLYATVTRGSYLAVAAGLLFIGLVKNRKLIIPLLVILILVIVFAPPYVESRIRSIVDMNHPENISRMMMWTAGWRIFLANPIVGVGDIDLGNLMRQYADPGYPGVWGHLHNIPLQFLATLGLVGFFAVTAMFTAIVMVEWRVYRRVRQEWFRGSVALGALAVFVGFQVNGLTEWTFGDQELVVLFWSTVGLTLAAGRMTAAEGEKT